VAASVTPLPGVERLTPPTIYRVAFGEVVTRDGKSFPQRLGHFIITRPAADSKRGARYARDPKLQQALETATGDKQPKRVPIRIWTNRIAEVLRTERAFYWGGRRVCHCGEFHLKTEQQARAAGLSMWPPPDPAPEPYWIGMAERRSYRTEGKRKVLRGVREQVCDPALCPFATGNWSTLSPEWQQALGASKACKPGDRLCKPHLVFAFELDLPDSAQVGAVAKLTSTAWSTAQALYGSLARIAERTQGWLAGLPLQLVLEHRMQETPGGLQSLPYAYVETRVPSGELEAYAQAQAARLAAQREDLRLLSEGRAAAVAAAVGSEDSEQAQAAHNLEFSPATAEGDDLPDADPVTEVVDADFEPEAPVADELPAGPLPDEQEPSPPPVDEPLPVEAALRERAREAGRQLGLSDAAVAQDLAQCDSPDSYLDLLDTYSRRINVQQTRPRGPQRLFGAEGEGGGVHNDRG